MENNRPLTSAEQFGYVVTNSYREILSCVCEPWAGADGAGSCTIFQVNVQWPNDVRRSPNVAVTGPSANSTIPWDEVYEMCWNCGRIYEIHSMVPLRGDAVLEKLLNKHQIECVKNLWRNDVPPETEYEYPDEFDVYVFPVVAQVDAALITSG